MPLKNSEKYSEDANLSVFECLFPFIFFLIFHVSLILKEMDSNTEMTISAAKEQPAIGVLSANGVRVLDEPIPVDTNKVGVPKPSGAGIQRGTNPHYALRSGNVLPKPSQRSSLPKVQQPRERKSGVAPSNGSSKKGVDGSKGCCDHTRAQDPKVGSKVRPARLHSPAAASSSSVSVKEKVRGGGASSTKGKWKQERVDQGQHHECVGKHVQESLPGPRGKVWPQVGGQVRDNDGGRLRSLSTPAVPVISARVFGKMPGALYTPFTPPVAIDPSCGPSSESIVTNSASEEMVTLEVFLQNFEEKTMHHQSVVFEELLSLKKSHEDSSQVFNNLFQHFLSFKEDLDSLKESVENLAKVSLDLGLSLSESSKELSGKLVLCTNTLYMQMKEQGEQNLQIPVLLRNKIDNLEPQLKVMPETLASLINPRSAPQIVNTPVSHDIPSREETLFAKNGQYKRESPPHLAQSVKPEMDAPVKEELLLSAKPVETPPPMERFFMGRGNNYPKTSGYPTFEGKPDEDWVNFIEIIVTLQSSYELPDAEITSRLPTILTGVARVWYRVACKANQGASWNKWKELIQRKYNTPTWRIKQLSLLEKEKFSYTNGDTLGFLLNMLRSIQAVYPGNSLEGQMNHILIRLPVELHTSIRNSVKDVVDISEFITIVEEVIDNSWGKQNSLTRTFAPYKRNEEPHNTRKFPEKKKPVSVPLHGSSNDAKPREGKTFWKCKAPWA